MIDIKEDNDLLFKLSNFNNIFQTFWMIGTPVFTNHVQTAAVGFDPQHYKVYMFINPDFWNDLDLNNKAFVICHECLHIILNHFKRSEIFINEGFKHEIINIAQDISINEMLVNGFGFIRSDIKNWESFCFVDTVFSIESIIKNQIHKYGTFGYYLDLLKKDKKANKKELVDQHSENKGSNSDEKSTGFSKDEIDRFISNKYKEADSFSEYLEDEINSHVSDYDKNDFSEKIKDEIEENIKLFGAGNVPFGKYINIQNIGKKKQKGWEIIVKNHVKSIIKKETVIKDSWIGMDRKYIALYDEGLLLQSPAEQEKRIPEKYNLVFFLDASGSCLNHANRFVELLKSIPDDKFKITAYSFDTELYPINLKDSKVRGCGGTNFRILNEEIDKITKDENRHPDAIFIVTDGDGQYINPAKPHLWHWILTPRHTKRAIHKNSKTHLMSKFES